MDDLERVKERLENIQSVEPIIASLRTIAAGSWRLALRRLRAAEQYQENLGLVLGALLAQMPTVDEAYPYAVASYAGPRRAMVLAIASERGLCGSFNDVVLRGAERVIAQQSLQSEVVRVATLGHRAELYFRARGQEPVLARSLPLTRVVSFALVRELAQSLLDELHRGEVNAVYVVYAPYRAAAIAEPVAVRWLPLEFAAGTADGTQPPALGAGRPLALSVTEAATEGAEGPATEEPLRSVSADDTLASMFVPYLFNPPWPPPDIATDKKRLWLRVLHEWALVSLYRYVIESAASEQSARYRAMEAASSNLARLIEELTLYYHSARQHAITMEMLDLVAGSGILRQKE